VVSSREEINLKIVLQPSSDYPNHVPQMSVFSDQISRDIIIEAKQKAVEFCKAILGDSMLVSLSIYLQEYFQDLLDSGQIANNHGQANSQLGDTADNDIEAISTSVLKIDHMRSKTKYCKTLDKWASDLKLSGRIVFCNKLILVILQGNKSNIKVNLITLYVFSSETHIQQNSNIETA